MVHVLLITIRLLASKNYTLNCNVLLNCAENRSYPSFCIDRITYSLVWTLFRAAIELFKSLRFLRTIKNVGAYSYLYPIYNGNHLIVLLTDSWSSGAFVIVTPRPEGAREVSIQLLIAGKWKTQSTAGRRANTTSTPRSKKKRARGKTDNK